MKDLDISEVARRTGTAASTLRYYEDKGLIRSIGRKGLKRLFDPAVVERLALIALGRTAGFSLDEIAGMLSGDGEPNIDRGKLVAKADEIDETIRRLSALSRGLRHASECSAPSHMECPTFRRLLSLAGAGAMSPPKSLPGKV